MCRWSTAVVSPAKIGTYAFSREPQATYAAFDR
jgi:hypothetical protein